MPSSVNAAMKPSSIAIRASTKTVKLNSVNSAANTAGRTRPSISHTIANTPSTVAVPASVEKKRHPRLLSPSSRMPPAMISLASSGCSMLRGPASAISVRAAGT